MKTQGIIIALTAFLFTQPAFSLDCEAPFTTAEARDKTVSLVCQRSWADLQSWIQLAYGFTGPGDLENSEPVIKAKRLIAALNTLDGAAGSGTEEEMRRIGSELSEDADLRNVTRATMLHVAYGSEALESYCTHLFAKARKKESVLRKDQLLYSSIEGTLSCGTQ
jgi:hypothetical protein